MKWSRMRLALTVVLGISGGGFAGMSAGVFAQEKADAKGAAPPTEVAGDRAVIHGRSIGEWLAALKGREAAIRRRSVEVLGEYAWDPAVRPDERSRLMRAVVPLMFSDKDPAVRESAAFFSDLERFAGSPERVKRAIAERRRAIRPTDTPVRLLDAEGRPVAGAVAAAFFSRDADRDPAFAPPDPAKSATSDANGEVGLTLEVPGHLDAAAVYALRRDGDRSLVGMRRVTGEEIRAGRPIAVVLHPACRVRLRVECPGFRALEEKFRVDLRGGDWWRAAYVWLGEDHRSPRPLFTSSSRGELEFLLPPGRYMIMAYGSDVKNIERVIEVKPGHRVLSLGVLEVEPSERIRRGDFDGFWRSIRRDAGVAPNDPDAKGLVTFRRPRWGMLLKGDTRYAADVAYSPDGRLLATAHSYNADPGEVKLWDAATGASVATWPLADRGIRSLAFSPDGQLLAGVVYRQADRSLSEVVVWDIASRREVRTLGGPGSRIGSLAFSPHGRTLATGGPDRTLRFWDATSGRETRRVDGIGIGGALAFSPDGGTLALSGERGAPILWDIAANRPNAALEPAGELFNVFSVTFSPDGRSLVAAGWIRDGVGQVTAARLYDLTEDPPVRRAQLVPNLRGPGGPDRSWISDVAFTPDGRRVVGLMMERIAIWDATTGAERDSLRRTGGSSSDDMLAISPDGRWLAFTQPGGNGIGLLDISPTGP